MTEALHVNVDAELEQAQAQHRERRRLEKRALDADRLELELAAERAGLPPVKLRAVFLERYDGPPSPDRMRLAWADLIGDYSWLSPSERVTRLLTLE